MSATVRTYVDPVTKCEKSFKKITSRHNKRQDNEDWQRVAREFKGVQY